MKYDKIVAISQEKSKVKARDCKARNSKYAG